ncbi:Uncharacterised protein [Weissella viridescens]|uniref:Uncharacterized protein n=1 Tax=Weissella viridescens TaxID=1629 RepID=A0A380NY17_WEIVI|nr:Uncharacterised protein [Weissella viridescens]
MTSETSDLMADKQIIQSVLFCFQKKLYAQSSLSLPTPITYSAGVSHTVFHNYHTLRAFEKADLFLFQSKTNGRNRFHLMNQQHKSPTQQTLSEAFLFIKMIFIWLSEISEVASNVTSPGTPIPMANS